MTELTKQKCINHGSREAVARCPSCGSFFCRECITEHEGRVMCAACLASLSTPARKQGRFAGAVQTTMMCFASIFILWLLFYGTGRVLLSIPAEFHEGTLWKSEWWEIAE